MPEGLTGESDPKGRFEWASSRVVEVLGGVANMREITMVRPTDGAQKTVLARVEPLSLGNAVEIPPMLSSVSADEINPESLE